MNIVDKTDNNKL